MTRRRREPKPHREYKSRMFTMIFHEKKTLLELYNAISGNNYEDPELLTINTLEDAIYMSMKNDISFLIDSTLSLYEHQSSYNPNMPLRFLFYVSDLYSSMTMNKNRYGSKLIPLPTPEFIVFYNGRKERPDREELYLSDAYMKKKDNVSLELKVTVININAGHNQEMMETCKTLSDYSEYVRRIRKYAADWPIEEAVEYVINECIHEGILREFLEKNRAEAKAVSIYEYDEEEHMRMEREEYFAEGRETGFAEGHETGFTEGRETGFTEGHEAGRAEERANTERERKRAESAEAELKKIREEWEKLKNNI